MSLPFVDNSVAYGSSRAVTNAGTLVAENITLSFTTTLIERKDQLGAPSGFVLVKGQPTGSCTLQIPTNASTYPQVGDTITSFSDITVTAAGTHPWAISQVGQAYEQGGIWKVNVNLVLALFT